MNDAVQWLIYSREHNAFWRADGLGYTVLLEDAGRFTVDQVVEICRRGNQRPCPDGGTRHIAFPAMTAVC